MNHSDTPNAESLHQHTWWARPAILGTFCGAVSAVAYTAANICLREAADTCDPVWVSFVKAVPTAVVAGVWLQMGMIRGKRIWPARNVLIALILAGLLGQLGGNVLFQYALGVIGIGLTVPLCMGMIIIASAVLARVYLNESVTRAAMLSMAILILAIWVLSMGAGDAFQSIAEATPSVWQLVVGVGAALLCGFAYAVLGVVIRFGVSGRASIAATTFLIAMVGIVVLGVFSYGRLGWQGIVDTRPHQWVVMTTAGVFNFIAFLALAKALQLTTVVYVNALNASQVAMAAVAGVLLFGESSSSALAAGVLLTIGGLVLMRPERAAGRPKDQRPSEPTTELRVQNERNLSSNSTSCPSSQAENSVAATRSSELSPTCSCGGDDTGSVV
ncbi:MAG: DMT family transporter [Pirellulaceae bacterium]